MSAIELSVVIPCLNEERTIGVCVKKCLDVFHDHKIQGEVVVVDNGSTDRSAEIARQAKARVIAHDIRGYGAALMRGITEAKGNYLLMADADNTYDFYDIPKFVGLLKSGADLVMGSRLRGKISPKAMPWLHRWVGTPVLTAILNLFFGSKISDVNCGMRGFTRATITRLNLKCRGMEFASEMVVKAAQRRMNIKETPINYYPGLPGRTPNLHTFRDGWRHLRFMLMMGPKYLFMLPGALLFVFGLLFSGWLLLTERAMIFNIPLGLSTAIFANALALTGLQVVFFGVYAIIFNTSTGLQEEDSVSRWAKKYFNLEAWLLAGSVILFGGLISGAVTAGLLYQVSGHMSEISIPVTKLAIISIFLFLLGIQIVFSSFYLSLFNLNKTLE
jgi:glycosyltransferase involved in cell wall biosynthesis